MPVPQVHIVGRAVADARSGYAKDGTPWVMVRVACSDQRKGDDGQWYDVRSIFIDVSWWGADDRIHLPAKGDKVSAFGKLYSEDEEYQGQTYHKTKLMADFIKAWPKRESQGDTWSSTSNQSAGSEEPPF